MNRSESIKELATALAKAQAELKNPAFDAVNPHFKSKFASLAAVRDAVIPVFSKHGLSVSQWPTTDGAYAGCRTVLAHASGEWMEETFIIPVDKPSAHGYASAVTYAKRLSMQAIAAVVGDEDDDGNGAVDKPAPSITPAAVLREHYDALPQDMKDYMDTLAHDLRSMLGKDDAEGAWLHLEAQDLNAENKSALWSLLDSKCRAAIKKQSQLRKDAS